LGRGEWTGRTKIRRDHVPEKKKEPSKSRKKTTPLRGKKKKVTGKRETPKNKPVGLKKKKGTKKNNSSWWTDPSSRDTNKETEREKNGERWQGGSPGQDAFNLQNLKKSLGKKEAKSSRKLHPEKKGDLCTHQRGVERPGGGKIFKASKDQKEGTAP